MTGKRKPTACSRCRDRHLRCEGGTPCKTCREVKVRCERGAQKLRFKHASVPKRFHFSADQEWVRAGGGLRYVHVRPDGETVSSSPDAGSSSSDTSPSAVSPSAIIWRRNPRVRENQTSQEANGYAGTSLPDSTDGYPAQRDRYRLGPLKGVPQTFSDVSYTTDFQEACLIRYFVENLAHWFDCTDKDRHFALTVPNRAMFCPVLRYALFTASAGHMRQLLKFNDGSDAVIFHGIPLPGLTEDSAIQYHTICISHLIEISSDPKESYNEDVLTAATILRFYEQIDAPSAGTDREAYLKTAQYIVSTQQDDSFYAATTIHGPPPDNNINTIPHTSLRHSACLIALRQEIWSAFLNQRSMRLPIAPNNIYTLDSPCPFTSANRILVWCADLLNFTFDTTYPTPTTQARKAKWESLKSLETTWSTQKPSAFKPIYYAPPAPKEGKYFPTIWLANDAQVVAEQHVELARILLAVSDPSIPRLGAGAGAMNRALEEELRVITRRLIGLGLSNWAGPPALVTSAVGISICGEYFVDPGEREAVVRVLGELEVMHAWPTSGIVEALREAWE